VQSSVRNSSEQLSSTDPIRTGVAYLRNQIYVGFWINWSKGSTAGLTLTLTHRQGAYLTAFVAILVTYTGRCVWNIARFIIHQRLCTPPTAAKDAVYHQRQAILRNTDSGLAAAWRFLQMSYAWRGNQVFRKIVVVLFFSSLLTLSAIAASILSSQVANSTGDEVLISSPNCGWQRTPNSFNYSQTAVLTARVWALAEDSLNQADLCYGQSSLEKSCSFFVKPKISYNLSRDIECPFKKTDGTLLCAEGSRAIRLDSGYFNSHHDLGFNTKPKHQFLWRNVAECSPLNMVDYTSVEKVTLANASTPRSFFTISIGQWGTEDGEGFQDSNITYQYPNDEPVSKKEIWLRRTFHLE
jgi:hypothetical protein